MRSIVLVNPEAYAVHALRLLMYKGASLTDVLGDLAFAVSGAVVGLGTMAFQRRL